MRKGAGTATWLALAAALLASGTKAGAQNPYDEKWRFSVTPYLWLTGIDGTVGVGQVVSNVDLGAGDVLGMLKFAIMGSADARKGRWVLSADGLYASLGAGRVVAFRGDTGSLELTQHETMIQPVGGYTMGDETWSVDLLGGFRYWNMGASLDVDRATRPSNKRSGSTQWVDATGGFRFRWTPEDDLRLGFAADGGGGGARSTWQLATSLGWDAWSQWTLGVAYRVLAVDYVKNDFEADTKTKGFMFGVTYRFQ